MGIKECNGRTLALRRQNLDLASVKRLLTLLISSQPGKKHKIAPSKGFSACIVKTKAATRLWFRSSHFGCSSTSRVDREYCPLDLRSLKNGAIRKDQFLLSSLDLCTMQVFMSKKLNITYHATVLVLLMSFTFPLLCVLVPDLLCLFHWWQIIGKVVAGHF